MNLEKFGFYKKKEIHRKEERKKLPFYLQLEFPQKRPEKEKWSFEGQLLKLRNSKEPEDKLFIEDLRMKIKKELGKEITKEEKEKLAELEEKVKKKREAIADRIEGTLLAKQAMERLLERGWFHYAGEIAVELAKLGEKEKEMINTAKQAIERFFEIGWFSEAGKIAIELAKLGEKEMINTAKQAMERSFKQEFKFYNPGEIAVELAKLGEKETAKQAMKRLFKKGRKSVTGDSYYYAGKIAIELAKLGEKEMIKTAKQAMERLFEKFEFYYAGKIAIGLAKLGEKEMINTAKQAMEELLKRRWFSDAGKIAIELAKLGEKEMTTTAKQAMERLFFKKFEFYDAGKIAIELAKLGEKEMITPAKQAIERLFGRGEFYHAGKLAIELAKLGEPSPRLEEILEKHKISEREREYIEFFIAKLLRQNKDLGEVILEYLSSLRAQKERLKEINENLREEKQIKDIEEFFKKHQVQIANLQSIDLKFGERLIESYAKNYGFPRLKKFLEDIVDYQDFSPLAQSFSKISNLNTEYFARLIEIVSAYQRAGLEEELKKQLELRKENKAKELIRDLGRELLKEFARKIGIKGEIEKESFDKWNLIYLPKLFTAEKLYKLEAKEFLNLIIKLSFQEKNFLASLFGKIEGSYTEKEKEWLKEIQKYNLKVKEEFEKEGIDFNLWLNYPKKEKFFVGKKPEEIKVKKEAFQRELLENIRALLGSYREKIPGILDKQQAKKLFNNTIKKYQLSLKEKEIYHPKKGKLSLRDLQMFLEDFIQQTEKIFETEKDETKKERIGTILDHFKELKRRIPDLEKETGKKGYEFEIKLWQREPGYDIFQGNYTSCCVALETGNQAILDYLIDSGFQVVEVRNVALDQTIAQTWLYFTKDSHKNLNLVLDNIEINKDYLFASREIREEIFKYCQNLAKEVSKGKVKRILLGTVYNDVETSDLDLIKLSLRKIGGAPREREYLEALGPGWVDLSQKISKKLFLVKEFGEKEKKVKKEFEIERVKEFSQKDLREIEEVERASFPPEMQSDLEDLRETLLQKKGVQIILREKGGKILGYLSSKPQDVAYKELKEWDKDFKPNKKALYVESIAIKPEARGLKTFLNMLKELKKQAAVEGYEKISCHARVQNGLSDFLQKRGARKLRRIENWHNFGEPFDYLEIEIENIK